MEKIFFGQPLKNKKIIYENRKLLLVKKMIIQQVFYQVMLTLEITIDLSKQQALDADTRAIQQINFRANLDDPNNTRIFIIFEKQKKLSQSFHKEKFCKQFIQ